MKNISAKRLRELVRKPDDFKGSQKEYSRLIMSLLAPPDPRVTWVKNKQNVWEAVAS